MKSDKNNILDNLHILPAEKRAMLRPEFNITDPLYPEFIDDDKRRQMENAELFLLSFQEAVSKNRKNFTIPPGIIGLKITRVVSSKIFLMCRSLQEMLHFILKEKLEIILLCL